MFHSEKTDFRPALRVFSSQTALDDRAQSGRAFCPQLVSALCGAVRRWRRCGVSRPALSRKVGEVPRRCPLRPVCPPALRDTPSCVHRRLPRSGEKLPGTAKQGLGGWHIPTQICMVLFNLIQCEDWLVVRQWSKDMSLSFSHLISIFKMFSLDTVLAVVTVYKTE